MTTRFDELRSIDLFGRLTDQQLSELMAGSTEVDLQPGLELFREGEHADFWWVLLDGAVDLTRRVGGEQTAVAEMNVPGRWAGGFRAWDDQGVYLATGRAATTGRMLRIPAEVLRERINAWFPLGGHLIEGLYRTARSIEATARQRQSLITLGTLAAGLAHELNNPAAAAVRAVDALEDACQSLLGSVSQLAAHQVPAEQLAALDKLRQEVTGPAVALDALALADLEDELAGWLTRHGVGRDWLIAPSLAAAGVDTGWCERAAAILDGPALEPGLEWVASAWSAATLLAEVKESTRRISALVAAVKSYTQMDQASMQRIDVAEGLDSTLIMLGHMLGDGVTVVREYDASAPAMDVHAGELNQVWTNLISNAVEAMDGQGTLRVSTRAEHGSIVIEIADTGRGMPPQVAARAFEPFFTTKDAGKNSGLGLDIARRIITERHGGTIEIDSRPGRTVLRVQIPVRTPDLPDDRAGGRGRRRRPPPAQPRRYSRTSRRSWGKTFETLPSR
ncbi:MAG: sensor histidine kinase [Streptosporangiaceae bacterium]